MAKGDVVTAAMVVEALRKRYEPRAYAFFTEVGSGTGSGQKRRADAVAVSLWPSRGLFVEGIEIKVQRRDWLAELRSPEKGDEIGKYCDFLWLAVGEASIVKDGELPDTWGLLVFEEGKLTVKKQAPKLAGADLDRSFVCALLRRGAEGIDKARQAIFWEGHAKGREAAPKLAERDRTHAERELAELRESVAEFEKRSGLVLNEYNGASLGDSIRRLQQLKGFGNDDPGRHLESAAKVCEHQATMLREAKARLEKELTVARGAPALPAPKEVA